MTPGVCIKSHSQNPVTIQKPICERKYSNLKLDILNLKCNQQLIIIWHSQSDLGLKIHLIYLVFQNMHYISQNSIS